MRAPRRKASQVRFSVCYLRGWDRVLVGLNARVAMSRCLRLLLGLRVRTFMALNQPVRVMWAMPCASSRLVLFIFYLDR
jgi:hypothetical protein